MLPTDREGDAQDEQRECRWAGDYEISGDTEQIYGHVITLMARRRGAPHAHVSTDSDEQFTGCEAQID